MTKAMTTTDYSQYANMGMKNITAEDIRPPMMFLVQGSIDKTELVDAKGKECPDGQFYIKSFKEVLKKVRGYVIWIRKDHYEVRDEHPTESDIRWSGSRMYRVVFVRKDDLTPLAITFKKSSLSALSDLLTVSKSKNLPVFLFEVEIEAVTTTNKKGQIYFKSVVNVIGPEQNEETKEKLFIMSQGFDTQDEVKESEEEVSTPSVSEEDLNDSGIMVNESEELIDDIPFS